jgi:hypothetical protein
MDAMIEGTTRVRANVEEKRAQVVQSGNRPVRCNMRGQTQQ